MKLFFQQLRLLLWKNFTLRRRQMLRNVVEIVWPLAIFIILVSVRHKRPPERKPTFKNGTVFGDAAYFTPRALPSAGALPFLQSLICDYRLSQQFPEPIELPDFRNSVLNRLVRDLAPILTNETRLENLQNLGQDLESLTKDLTSILSRYNQTGELPVSDLFGSELNARIELQTLWNLSPNVSGALSRSKLKLDGVLYVGGINESNVMSKLSEENRNSTINDMKKKLCEKDGVQRMFDLPQGTNITEVRNELCAITLLELEEVTGIVVARGNEIFRDILNITGLSQSDVDRTIEEFDNVAREVQSLQNLKALLSDLQSLLPVGESPYNAATLALNPKTVLCGNSHENDAQPLTTMKPSSTKTMEPETTTRPTTTTTTATTTTKPPYPDHGGGINNTCNKINPNNRFDCGWGGIKEGQCLTLGCCYDSSIKGAKYCFCPTLDENSCCYKRRKFIDVIVSSVGYTNQMVDFLTTALEGKIMYTPDNNKTKEVVSQISSYLNIFTSALDRVKDVKQLLKDVVNITETFVRDKDQLERFEVLTKELIKQVNNTDINRYKWLLQVFGNNTSNTVDRLFNQSVNFIRENNKYLEYINSSYVTEERVQMVRNVTEQLFQALDLVDGLSSCYNFSQFFKAMPSEDAIIAKAINTHNFLSSIVFLNLDEDKPFPKKVEYKIRYNPDYVPNTARIVPKYWKPGPGPFGSDSFWHYQYVNFGFVFLQDMIERSLIQILANKTVPQPGLYIQQFPYPCYIQDTFVNALGNSMPLFMTLAWIYTIAMIIKSIVYEKETRLKEVMKVMGLTNTVHWTAWFITSLVTMFITVVLLAILLKAGKILIYSDITVVIFVMMCFACASIALAFLISVFFGRANIAAACGGIIYFFTYLPYPLTLWFEEEMNFSSKGFVSLLSTTSFGLTIKYIARWEEQGVGAQWSNFYDNPMATDTFSLGWGVNFMIIDIFLYLLIMWYFEQVLPGQYGIPRPFYFPFTLSYWVEKRKLSPRIHADLENYETFQQSLDDMHGSEMESRSDTSGKFESEMTNAKLGVHIQNLVKVYQRGKKRAVDGLNLKLFEGNVNALLGHNGAGKSTTMSILTGLFPPTSGTAVVYGHDIRTDIESVRKSIGLCPQYNVLFDNMTVAEHMWFYGKLKGKSDKLVKEEIERFLIDVGLPEKRDELSRNLSGGMKRKLSVAMAFIAESKTIILDEPTSGVDPYSRRSIWDLILKHKKGRTVLLSTHYMDEADLLGDRISIIANGRLQCSGTPLFLKRRFGKGYFLTVTKDTENRTAVFDPNEIKKYIETFVPGAKMNESFGTEVSYILPSAARLTGEFSSLFENLEDSLTSLGIKNYGISDTTLEEVFLKACDEDILDALAADDTVSLTGPVQSRRTNTGDDTVSLNSMGSQIGLLNTTTNPNMSIDDVCEMNLSRGPLLWFQQFKAILIKRFHHARRSKKGFFSQILLPAIFVVAAMVVALIRPARVVLPSLMLTPSMFGKPNFVIVQNKNMSVFSDQLMKSYTAKPGLGPECVEPRHTKLTCQTTMNPFFNHNITRWFSKDDLPKCSCSTGTQQCPNMAFGEKPREKTVATEDIVVDVTGRDMNDYLLKTMMKFIRKRYGGAQFGEELFDASDIIIGNNSVDQLVSNYGVQKNVKVLFNLKGYHALPTYINVMNNAVLRSVLDAGADPNEYGIVAYNHPMDFNLEQLDEEAMRKGIVDLFVAIFVILALAFVPASFLVYLVQDRVSKSKHLQLVSGLNPVIYWFANFTWDLVNYLIPAFCCIIIFLAFQQDAYVSSNNFGPTVLLLFLYGWSMTPLMYPASFVFDVPSTAYIVLIAVNLFVGIIGTIATFILEFFSDGDEELTKINKILKQVFLIFPNYCLGRGLMDLAGNQLVADIYQRFGTNTFKDPFRWEIIGRNVFAMFFCGILYMVLTLLCQYRFFVKPWVQRVDSNPKENEEEDVEDEKERISEEELRGKSFILKTDDLTKMYKSRFRNKKTLAVDRVNFGVLEGECFGLLGVNGAGKTSTFKMLTGDTNITAGDAYIKGFSVRANLNDTRKFMGYCPQFDALDELLTGKELLQFYAEIRGMSRKDGATMSDWAIETLDLTPYKDKICGDYSGGNKRKLSTAISLLGSPPLIFLDEPTTGMDPGARRFLWTVINGLLKSGKSVVLTSHSMEECETLCSKLAIMVNGQFQCLGSPQHLRSKFGTGYTVIIRAKPRSIESVQDFINANFTNAKLKDQHHYMLEYQIPVKNLLLSQVFRKLELLRKTNTIEDYSVTQTTLDQIFVNFARNQVEAVQIEENSLEASQTIIQLQTPDTRRSVIV